MISFSTATLDLWLAAYLFPLARITGVLMVAPMFGHRGVPKRVKLLLTLAITIAIAPMLGAPPQVPPASGIGLAILAEQLLIGLALGYVMRIASAAIDMAGELTGLQMGLGFATFFDPQSSTNTGVVAQLFGLLAMLLFLAINGHLIVLSLLAQSFTILPVGLVTMSDFGFERIAAYGAQIFVAGLLLALPFVAALLAANIALGMLTRAAPQLNLFAVGFTITLLAGFLLMALILPRLVPSFEQLYLESANYALQWVGDIGRTP
jgi:flagellar biosynthesis protein FliR